MKKYLLLFVFLPVILNAQVDVQWKNVDSLFQPLPASIKVFYTDQKIDTAPFKAYYVIADLKDKNLNFTTDTTHKRRLTPQQFYAKNKKPLIVVNGTFFSFETNQNLNVVIKDGKVISHNSKTIKSSIDTSKRLKVYSGAIGITKKGKADVAWIRTDSTKTKSFAVQFPMTPQGNFMTINKNTGEKKTAYYDPFKKWKVETAIGGGPVLVQDGKIKISNEEERMFTGKAINDKHPRTAMGYTADRKLIILVIEGRNPAAAGATLIQEAQILKQLGCVEALNLDGGGSSTLLINGKETIVPSDKGNQRPVPAVFMIQNKR